jgi:hypothetical protein
MVEGFICSGENYETNIAPRYKFVCMDLQHLYENLKETVTFSERRSLDSNIFMGLIISLRSGDNSRTGRLKDRNTMVTAFTWRENTMAQGRIICQINLPGICPSFMT